MSISYKVKTSQLDVSYGKAHSQTLFVDNDYSDGTIGTTGLGLGKLVAIKSDGESSAPLNAGKTVPTLKYADASTLAKAVSFVWRTSARAVDTTVTDMLAGDDANYYPWGPREDESLTMIREGEIVVVDTLRDFHFNTTRKAMAGTSTIENGSDTFAGAGTAYDTELRVGDVVYVGTEVLEIQSIASATVMVATSNLIGTTVTAGTTYIESDLYRTMYTGEDGLATIATPATSAKLSQKIGYVVNGNNFHIDFSIDPNGSIIA